MQTNFVKGDHVEILVIGSDKVIDEGIIKKTEGKKLIFQSEKLNPGDTFELELIPKEGWKNIYEGPGGEICFSERSSLLKIMVKM